MYPVTITIAVCILFSFLILIVLPKQNENISLPSKCPAKVKRYYSASEHELKGGKE